MLRFITIGIISLLSLTANSSAQTSSGVSQSLTSTPAQQAQLAALSAKTWLSRAQAQVSSLPQNADTVITRLLKEASAATAASQAAALTAQAAWQQRNMAQALQAQQVATQNEAIVKARFESIRDRVKVVQASLLEAAKREALRREALAQEQINNAVRVLIQAPATSPAGTGPLQPETIKDLLTGGLGSGGSAFTNTPQYETVTVGNLTIMQPILVGQTTTNGQNTTLQQAALMTQAQTEAWAMEELKNSGRVAILQPLGLLLTGSNLNQLDTVTLPAKIEIKKTDGTLLLSIALSRTASGTTYGTLPGGITLQAKSAVIQVAVEK